MPILLLSCLLFYASFLLCLISFLLFHCTSVMVNTSWICGHGVGTNFSVWNMDRKWCHKRCFCLRFLNAEVVSQFQCLPCTWWCREWGGGFVGSSFHISVTLFVRRVQKSNRGPNRECMEKIEGNIKFPGAYLDTWSGFEAAKTAPWPSQGLHHCGKFLEPSDEWAGWGCYCFLMRWHNWAFLASQEWCWETCRPQIWIFQF